MLLGVILVLVASLIWGLIFVVPLFMDGFTPFEIVLGRHFCFGALSLGILARFWWKGTFKVSLAMVPTAFKFALVTNIVYYITLVLALRSASAAVTALIAGLSPITIALYGNLKQHTYRFKNLIAPSILILFGLLLVNLSAFENHWVTDSIEDYLFGLACAMISLIAWTWYVVANADFLKRHPEVPCAQWATMIGIATFCWVVVIATIIGVIDSTLFDITKMVTFEEEFIVFLAGCLTLGIICSWCGSYAWNRASTLLPIALAGQLTIFETIFALILVFFVEQRVPFHTETAGIIFMLGAIAGSLWFLSSPEPTKEMEISKID